MEAVCRLVISLFLFHGTITEIGKGAGNEVLRGLRLQQEPSSERVSRFAGLTEVI